MLSLLLPSHPVVPRLERTRSEQVSVYFSLSEAMASQRQTSHTKAAVAEISSLWPATMPTIDRDSVVSMFTSKRSGASKHSSASSDEQGGKDLSERKRSCDEPREGEIRSHPVSAKTVFQKKKKRP